jgi:type IV pilus assembly protein PilX
MKPSRLTFPSNTRALPRQRGVVLLFALVALVVMLIASVALVRSFNTSLFTAGNIAFKRDLLNQGERVVPVVMAQMTTGVLAAPVARSVNVPGNNYSATMLKTNVQGIPEALLNDTAFATVGVTTNDIAVPTQKVNVRYVIDRLCDSTGLDATLGADHCSVASEGAPLGGTGSELQRAESGSSGGAGAVPYQVVYRLSIRVDGPRSTQAFFQTTFTL